MTVLFHYISELHRLLVSTVQGVGNTIVTRGFHVLSYMVLTIVTYFKSLIALTTVL